MGIVHEFKQHRQVFLPKITISDLFKPSGELICNILEDHLPTPYVKVPKVTCIPYGRFEVKWTFSNRFQKNTLQLMNVPQFEGIRVHSGTTEADTEGCLIPGIYLPAYPGMITSSRDSVKKVESIICPLLASGDTVYISIFP